MQQSLPRLFMRPILFAHRGANLVHPENTLPAFAEALRLGATGLETDVWMSRDGKILIDHDGLVRSGLRRRTIRSVDAVDIHDRFATFTEMLVRTPATVDISVDVKDVDAFGIFAALVHDAGRGAGSVWVCHSDLEVLQGWRSIDERFNFVHSTKLRVIGGSPEKHARDLRERGVRVCNMHWRDWSGGLVAMYHRFDVACFAWGLVHDAETREMIRIGMDGLYADDIEMLVSVDASTAV